jgi:hemerythrin
MDDDEMEELFEQHKPLFNAKDKIVKLLNKFEDINEVASVLTMVTTDFAIHDFDSEEEAMQMVSAIAAKCLVAIKAFSDSGLCAWNATRQ